LEELVEELLKAGSKETPNQRKSKSGIIIQGVGDTNVRFSKCCGPLPGDEIVGFVTRGRGVTIHRTDCVNIIHMDEFNRRRIIEAAWNVESDTRRSYRADLRIRCMDRDGLLLEITRLLSDEGLSVKALNVRTDHGEAVMDLGIEVHNRDQIQRLQDRIKQNADVYEIERTTT
jgi:GTP pyrophosphokinase